MVPASTPLPGTSTAHFGLARSQRDVLEVRQSVPTLTERPPRRLPVVLRADHGQVFASRVS
jgi:hypothetical protein